MNDLFRNAIQLNNEIRLKTIALHGCLDYESKVSNQQIAAVCQELNNLVDEARSRGLTSVIVNAMHEFNRLHLRFGSSRSEYPAHTITGRRKKVQESMATWLPVTDLDGLIGHTNLSGEIMSSVIDSYLQHGDFFLNGWIKDGSEKLFRLAISMGKHDQQEAFVRLLRFIVAEGFADAPQSDEAKTRQNDIALFLCRFLFGLHHGVAQAPKLRPAVRDALLEFDARFAMAMEHTAYTGKSPWVEDGLILLMEGLRETGEAVLGRESVFRSSANKDSLYKMETLGSVHLEKWVEHAVRENHHHEALFFPNQKTDFNNLLHYYLREKKSGLCVEVLDLSEEKLRENLSQILDALDAALLIENENGRESIAPEVNKDKAVQLMSHLVNVFPRLADPLVSKHHLHPLLRHVPACKKLVIMNDMGL